VAAAASPTTQPTDPHGKPICGARTRGEKRKPCGKPPGWGTDHVGFGECKLHGGCTATGRKRAARMEAEQLAAEWAERYAELEPDVDASDVLVRMVSRAAWLVSFYGRKYRELLHVKGDDGLVVASERTRTWHGVGGSETEDVPKGQGEETIVSNDVHLHIWGRLYHEAIDRAARLAKTALDAGVDERRIRLAESQADELAEMFREFIEALGLTADQAARAPDLLERTIRRFEVVQGGRAA
jgi:hypothetical protein